MTNCSEPLKTALSVPPLLCYFLLNVSIPGVGAFGAAPGSTKRGSVTDNTVAPRGALLGGGRVCLYLATRGMGESF